MFKLEDDVEASSFIYYFSVSFSLVEALIYNTRDRLVCYMFSLKFSMFRCYLIYVIIGEICMLWMCDADVVYNFMFYFHKSRVSGVMCYTVNCSLSYNIDDISLQGITKTGMFVIVLVCFFKIGFNGHIILIYWVVILAYSICIGLSRHSEICAHNLASLFALRCFEQPGFLLPPKIFVTLEVMTLKHCV